MWGGGGGLRGGKIWSNHCIQVTPLPIGYTIQCDVSWPEPIVVTAIVFNLNLNFINIIMSIL